MTQAKTRFTVEVQKMLTEAEENEDALDILFNCTSGKERIAIQYFKAPEIKWTRTVTNTDPCPFCNK